MSEIGNLLFFALLVALFIFLLWFFIFKVKHLKTPDVYMVDGGVKTGKSLVSVKLAITQYWKNLIQYYIRLPFIKLINHFRKKHNSKKNCTNIKSLIVPEKPMLYSNMPLYHVKYNPLTRDIIRGNVRIPHGSVCLCDEATLLADSMSSYVGNKTKLQIIEDINEDLTLFLKTYGHMTHGGKFFYNSQQVIDLHFAFKRNTSIYLWVARTRKFPFFCLSEVREVIHDESNDVINVVTRDVELDDRPLFVSKRWFKYYDRYYLDVLTKNLPVLVNYDVPKVIKKLHHTDIQEIVTLGTYKKILAYNEKHKKVEVKEVNDNEKK